MVLYNPSQEANDAMSRVEHIGRLSDIQQFEQALEKRGVKFVFVTGEGGIGKTRFQDHLVKKVLPERYGEAFYIAKPVDLYHIVTHSKEGFMKALADSVSSDGSVLSAYQKTNKELIGARAAGNLAEAERLYQATKTALTQDLGALSKKGLILTFDTGERWVYNAKRPDGIAEGWSYLLEVAGALSNAIIFMAGRNPELTHLENEAKAKGFQTLQIKLGVLSREETGQYVRAIVAKQGELEKSDEEINAIWVLSGGLPINISLYLENYLSRSDRNMSALLEEAGDYVNGTKEQRRAMRVKYEGEIINRLKSQPGINQIVVEIGRAPKGVDSELLAILLNRNDRNQAREILDQMRGYVFIKEYGPMQDQGKNNEEPRIFLHDRIYEMLKDTVYADRPEPLVRKKAFIKINEYYKAKIKRVMQRLCVLYTQAYNGKERFLIKLEEINQWEMYRYQLYSEIIYYSLRSTDFYNAVRYFTRYVHEAVVTNAPQALILPEQEMTVFTNRLDLLPNSPPDESELFFSESLLKLLQIQRKFAQGKHADVIQECERLSGDFQQCDRASNVECQVLLNSIQIWEGYSTIFHNKLEKAEEILTRAIRNLKEIPTPAVEWLTWYIDYMLGFSNCILGYLMRVNGRHAEATEYYSTALVYWKDINLRNESARTRNDHGFALAEQGKFFEAEMEIKKALEIRESLGLGIHMGLSLNTIADLYLRQGDYPTALRYATQAFNLFDALKYRRGIGLAKIALAEIHRRMAGEEAADQAVLDTGDRLLNAIDLASEAVSLFSTEPTIEKSREVEAQIELGCALRDRLRSPGEANLSREAVQSIIKNSQEAFKRAVELAREQKIHYRQVDALVNEAYLHYYAYKLDAGSLSKLDESIKNTEAILCAFLKITSGSLPKNNSEPTILWTQLGKLYSLKGNLALDQWMEKGKLPPEQRENAQELYDTARFYLMAICYDQHFGDEDFRELRKAKANIFERLNVLKDDEPTWLANAVERAEKHFKLTKSELRKYLRARGIWKK